MSVITIVGLRWWLSCQESSYKAGDTGSIPGLGRSLREGRGYPFQYSCLGNPVDRDAWRVAVYVVPIHDLATKNHQHQSQLYFILYCASNTISTFFLIAHQFTYIVYQLWSVKDQISKKDNYRPILLMIIHINISNKMPIRNKIHEKDYIWC